MKRILSLAVSVLLITACHSEVDQFRDGTPSKAMVEINLPSKTTSGLEAEDEVAQTGQAARGDRSDMYALTRGATALVNGGAVAILGLIKAITDHQPTSFHGNVAVWGPHTEDLSPNTWRLTVTRTGQNNFSYALEAKAKTAADSAYVAVLTGTHTAGDAQDVGSGEFLIDWDRAQTLPEHDNNVGTADITYSRNAAGAVVVSAQFRQVKDGASGLKVDADYRYSSASPGQGGSFDFATFKNLGDASQPALEKLTIRSRWLATGAGRADVKASGGDLGTATATANECWDINFASQYLAASWDSSAGYGTEATDCAFSSASYSDL